MTDAEILELIGRLQKGDGNDEEVASWIDLLKAAIPCAYISDVIFYGDPSATPASIFEKARRYRPTEL